LKISKHNGVDGPYKSIEVSSFSRMHILWDYFNLYPLLTTKRNDYDAFCKAFIIIQEKNI